MNCNDKKSMRNVIVFSVIGLASYMIKNPCRKNKKKELEKRIVHKDEDWSVFSSSFFCFSYLLYLVLFLADGIRITTAENFPSILMNF